MQIKEVMTREIRDIDPDATLKCAAEAMRTQDVGALPVRQDGKVIGMITDRDIAMRAVADGCDLNQTKVREAMSSPPLYCYETDDIAEAAALMQKKRIRRLPIFDAGEKLCGMVSLGDLATRMADDHGLLSGEVLERVSQPNIAHA